MEKVIRYQIVKVIDFDSNKVCAFYTFKDFDKSKLDDLRKKIQDVGTEHKWNYGIYMIAKCEDYEYTELEGVVAFSPDYTEFVFDNLSETITGTFDLYFKGLRMIGA